MTADDAARARALLERAEGIARSGRLFAAREETTGLLEKAGAALDEDGWRRALTLLARLSREAWRVPLVEPLERAAAAPGDAGALGALGSALIDEREANVAAAVLARARALAPEEARLLTELVAALELGGRNAEAVAALSGGGAAASGFLARYLLAFNTVMTGDVAGAMALLPGLVAASDTEGYLVQRLGHILARAAAVRDVTPLDERDLRGWHFVLTGGLLLHLAPEGRGVRGRYAPLADSETLIREVALRLESVLEALDLVPDKVVALDGAESRITGTALANLLRRPVDVVAPPTGEVGLVCAYDFAAFHPSSLAGYRRRIPGQILFSHSASSASEQPFTPDFVGVLYEGRTSPWQAHMPIDAALEPVLATRIVEADTDEAMLADLGELVALAVVAQSAGVLPLGDETIEREPLWVGSPVPRAP